MQSRQIMQRGATGRSLTLLGARNVKVSVSAQQVLGEKVAVSSPKALPRFEVTETMRETYSRDGFVHMRGVFAEEEMAASIDEAYNKFMSGAVPGTVPATEESPVLSVMSPREHLTQMQGNLLERKCEDIAMQLLGTDEVDLDFDQILAKRPRSRDSGVAWHQDAASWPPELAHSDGECMTANMWVAVSDVPVESGCMRYVPGSHLEGDLRPHTEVAEDQNDSASSLRAVVSGESARLVPMKRGDVVVHRENVVHGSGPNLTENWRKGYVLNFKRSTCPIGRL